MVARRTVRRLQRLFFALVTVLLAVSVLGSSVTAQTAEEELRRARDLVLDVELSTALAAVDRLLASGRLGPQGTVDAHALRAMCLIGLDRLREAEATFCDLLRLDPTWRPDPDMMTSDEIGIFYQAAPKCGIDLEPETRAMMIPESAGDFGIRPFIGLGVHDNTGLSVGALVTLAVTERLLVGPVFQFSTAGWRWQQTDPTQETEAAQSIVIGGRVDLLLGDTHHPGPIGVPYVFGGGSAIRFDRVDKYDDGSDIFVDLGQGDVPIDIKSETRFAGNIGFGTMLPFQPGMPLAFEASALFGSGTGARGRTDTVDDLDITNASTDTWWRVDLTVGSHFGL